MLHGMEPIMCYHVFIASFCKTYQRHVQKQFDEYDERITKHNEQMRARHNEAELEKWRKYEKNLQEWRDYVAQVEEGRAPDYDLEKAYDILSNEEPMPDSVRAALLRSSIQPESQTLSVPVKSVSKD